MTTRPTIEELARKKKTDQSKDKVQDDKVPSNEVFGSAVIPDPNTADPFIGGTIKIVDASFSGQQPSLLLQLKTANNEKLGESLTGLPEHHNDIARIFDFTLGRHYYRTGARYMIDLKDQDSLGKHLLPYIRNTYNTPPLDVRAPYVWENSMSLTADISLLVAQWSQDVQVTQHWPFVSTATSLGRTTDYTKLFVEDSFITCLRDGNQRLIVLVINVVGIKREFLSNDTPYRNPRLADTLTKSTAWITSSSGSFEQFTRLLLLDFFCCSIYLQDASFFSPLFQKHRGFTTISPQVQAIFSFSQRDWKANLSLEHIDFVSELQECERVLQDVDNINDSVNFLLHTLDSNQCASAVYHELYRHRCYILKETCNQRLENSKRRLDRLHRAFESRSKMSNMKDSISIKLLSILACIFLPLSLSSSLLSMQTRFIDPHLILYDFIRVFVLISSATVLIYLIVQIIMSLKSKLKRSAWSPLTLWRKQKRDALLRQRKLFRRTVAVILLCFYLLVWALTLLSFIFGMTINVAFGLKTLGFGLVGIAGFLVILIPALKWSARRMYNLEALIKDD